MIQLPDFEQQGSDLMCKLHKGIYGLKQTTRAWYDKLTQVVVHFGFIHSKCDHSLFIYSHQGVTMYAIVYVDDILINGSSFTLVHKLINSLHTTFALKNKIVLNWNVDSYLSDNIFSSRKY